MLKTKETITAQPLNVDSVTSLSNLCWNMDFKRWFSAWYLSKIKASKITSTYIQSTLFWWLSASHNFVFLFDHWLPNTPWVLMTHTPCWKPKTAWVTGSTLYLKSSLTFCFGCLIPIGLEEVEVGPVGGDCISNKWSQAGPRSGYCATDSNTQYSRSK